MKRTQLTWAIVALSTCLAGIAPLPTIDAAELGRTDALVYGSNIIGQTVKNREGERVGHIRELLIDPEKGSITYGVVEVGSGVLGVGNRMVALPWSDLRLSPTQDGYLIDLDKEALSRAPEFKREGRYERTAGPGEPDSEAPDKESQRYSGTIQKVDATAGTIDVRRLMMTYTFHVGPTRVDLSRFNAGDKVEVTWREQDGKRLIEEVRIVAEPSSENTAPTQPAP
jgi:sporulation protein YlmC with PRC-barrel domain